ncbi:hypothetical protein PAECIP111891_06716 [Paenibacillus allorhizoplanae]|uniref:Uncharacterized protein n=1 Tax=Paenibacillus allorhizoplanae TaxID=2905648 RepID=A0ABN8H5J6_9BACL|nr:DUF6711 family protein [Paenibacillus allorhizoplanae]CAH1230668.1 hypothetical protein PAECIP111891_06716 [Paenibacillus allorhizoplanae]
MTTALLNIGGVDMPTPSDLSVGIQDIVDAERNTNGKMIGELIATKIKLELSWKFLDVTQMSQILKAVKPFLFDVTYFDPEEGDFLTKKFYSGDRTVPMYDFLQGIPRYQNFKFNIIEQ